MFKREFSDGQLADYLRRKCVIDNWVSIESPAINEYWLDGELVAIVVFDNANMLSITYTCDMD